MKLNERWKSETPKFWQKVGKIGVAIGVVGGVLISGTIAVPATLVTIGGYMVAIGSVTKVLSKLTIVDNGQSND
jgi:ABC-type xylose transport system permease subunit